LSPDRFGILSASPSPADFGSVDENTGTADRTITVTNAGTAPLQIGAVSLMGPDAAHYAIVNDAASGQTLNPGDSRTVTVRFAPTTIGLLSAMLDLPNDAIPAPLDVKLSGTGLGARLDVAPASLSFAAQPLNTTSSSQSLTLTNTGNKDLIL